MAVEHVAPNQFQLTRTDAQHLRGIHEQRGNGGNGGDGNFGNLLMDSLTRVSDLQKQHDQLSVQAVLNPDSVDPHDVTIAAAKANLSLSITKAVVDRALQAYQKISNLR
jgi:flagellar hook-basal body complex protein FliE